MSDEPYPAYKVSMVLPRIKKFASRLGGACHILDPEFLALRYLNRHLLLVRNKDQKQNGDDANHEVRKQHRHLHFLTIWTTLYHSFFECQPLILNFRQEIGPIG